jgi:hypothetical protein
MQSYSSKLYYNMGGRNEVIQIISSSSNKGQISSGGSKFCSQTVSGPVDKTNSIAIQFCSLGNMLMRNSTSVVPVEFKSPPRLNVSAKADMKLMCEG